MSAVLPVYQVRVTPVSIVPNTSTLLEPPELDEVVGMVPEQALSASVAAAAAMVSHLRIVHHLARTESEPWPMVAGRAFPAHDGGYA